MLPLSVMVGQKKKNSPLSLLRPCSFPVTNGIESGMEHHEAYLALARQGNLSSLSCHFSYPSFNGLEKSLEKKPRKTNKKPHQAGAPPSPLPRPPFSYPSSY